MHQLRLGVQVTECKQDLRHDHLKEHFREFRVLGAIEKPLQSIPHKLSDQNLMLSLRPRNGIIRLDLFGSLAFQGVYLGKSLRLNVGRVYTYILNVNAFLIQ